MNVQKKYFYAIALITFPFLSLQAGQNWLVPGSIRLKHFSMSNGLPGETVRTVYEDKEGFIWMGIEAFGLCRYNGIQFDVYGHLQTDSSSLSSDFVEVIAEDSKGNLWIGTDFGLNRFDKNLLAISQGKKFKRYYHRENDPSSLAGNMVYALVKDHEGKLWIGTNGGLSILNNSGDDFSQFKLGFATGEANRPEVYAIYEDHSYNLWIGTSDGLFLISPQRKLLNHWNKSNSPLHSNIINSMCEDKSGIIWLGTQSGVSLFDKRKNEFSRLLFDDPVTTNMSFAGINRLKKTSDGRIWIGTFSNGLIIYNVENNSYQYFHAQDKNPEGLLSNQIREVLQDRQGMVWIAVKNKGIYIYDKRIETFELITERTDKHQGLSDKQVLSIYEDKSGILWIGTRFGGLNRFDPVKHTFTYYRYDPKNSKSVGSYRIESLTEDHQGMLWLATIDGLVKFDRKQNRFYHYEFVPTRCVQEDRYGQLWVGSKNGIYLFDRETSTYVVPEIKGEGFPVNKAIHTLLIDSYGKIWMGTFSDGLMEYDPAAKKMNWYKSQENSGGCISDNKIRAIYEDVNHNIWIGTKLNGINIFDRNTGQFKSYNSRNGLSSNSVFSIVGDNQGYLWLATTKGISRFNPQTEEFTNFTTEYGLQADIFISGAACKAINGKMYFGGDNGLNAFYPDKVEKQVYSSPIVITSVKSNENSIKANSVNNQILNFSYNDYISFEFALLSYSSPQKNNYAYKLEGLNNEWIYSNSRNYVSYINLSPGKYTFMVKGADLDGIWSDTPAKITFKVFPPWWSSWGAIFSYISTGILLSYLGYRLIRFRTLKQNEVRLLKIEKVQAEKLSQFKIRFFTNISHEIRTPLTLLLPLVEKLNSLTNMPKEAMQPVLLIKKNTTRLLNLVDELLEFRKIEQGQVKLQLKKADIIGFIKDITAPFAGMAQLKNIDFWVDCQTQSFEMLFDPGAMEKILSNLLSNAFKFTEMSGRIELSIRIIENSAWGEQFLEIKVKDNGKGIAKESVVHIFERYYQASADDHINAKGIGIGLDLTKSLVDLHHGRIYVESIEGEGTIFTVLLPIDEKHYCKDIVLTSRLNAEKYIMNFSSAIESKIPEHETISDPLPPSSNNYSILVIDDDIEIRTLLTNILSEEYKVYVAADAVLGAQIAEKHMPELIICDVIMPEINGIEFCKKLKSDLKTSHIPVILLSAGATVDHKIEGLESGADSYIAKPFHTRQLKAEIINLIKSRQKLREHFRKDIYLQPKELNIPSLDEKFITRCIEVVEKHLSDSDFGVAELSKEIGLSRTQLFRKLKALLEQTPLEFIYSTRLKRAARLLTEKHYPVSEVAYMTGFSSPTSFSTSFRKYFGSSPSQYHNDNSNKKSIES